MDIETQIKPDLWNAIEHSYRSENYTHSIRDAMSVLTDVLRDKSGLDGDGDTLVGQALALKEGKPPRIKVNKLQTKTEQDEQKGLILVLKGMYALVRNPRSHERVDDDKHTADTLILFIDYLLDFLRRAKQSFTVQGFLELVTDAHFVPDPEYVAAIADIVPARKLGDTLIALYRSKSWKQDDNYELVIKELLSRADEGVVEDFMSVVSEDLQKVDAAGSVTLVIKLLPNTVWPRIARMPRLRVEAMLLDELKQAWYVPQADQTNNPAASWLPRIAKHYLRKPGLREVIIDKLESNDFDQHNYVARYFFRSNVLPDIFEGEKRVEACVSAICDCVRSGNEYVKDRLLQWVSESSPEEWNDEFAKRLSDLTDPDEPELYLRDGRPLLGKFVPRTNPADEQEVEIPF